MGELKQRYPLASILYKVTPVILCLIGLVVWSISTLHSGGFWSSIRVFSTVAPVIGLTPIIIAPLGKIEPLLLVAHILSSLVLVTFLLRKSTNWFASHLEEV